MPSFEAIFGDISCWHVVIGEGTSEKVGGWGSIGGGTIQDDGGYFEMPLGGSKSCCAGWREEPMSVSSMQVDGRGT